MHFNTGNQLCAPFLRSIVVVSRLACNFSHSEFDRWGASLMATSSLAITLKMQTAKKHAQSVPETWYAAQRKELPLIRTVHEALRRTLGNFCVVRRQKLPTEFTTAAFPDCRTS